MTALTVELIKSSCIREADKMPGIKTLYDTLNYKLRVYIFHELKQIRFWQQIEHIPELST